MKSLKMLHREVTATSSEHLRIALPKGWAGVGAEEVFKMKIILKCYKEYSCSITEIPHGTDRKRGR